MAYLKHTGTPQRFANDPHGSGRYREGTGKNPFQHSMAFNARVRELEKQGVSQAEIAKMFGFKNSNDLRAQISINKDRELAANISKVQKLKQHGYSQVKIADIMGVNESNVRSWLKKAEEPKKETISKVADLLEKNVKEKKFIDIGSGVAQELGISDDKLKNASKILEKEKGYKIYTFQAEQMGIPGQKTTIKVLCPPGTEWVEVANGKIRTINEYSQDNGKTWLGIEPPKNISSDRIEVKYKEDGGSDKDGVIELRRGVEDISLGGARYAQVRIAVDGTHYLKGMAIYSDDLPPGVDLRFNTNKSKADNPNKLDVMKPMKKDLANPFGTTLRAGRIEDFDNGQRHYIDKDGKDQLSAINLVYYETDWQGWKKSLASQMLSKQDPSLAKRQLDLEYYKKATEFKKLQSLTNETIKKRLLLAFADDCDSSSVHLKAAALPRQASHVILPINSLKDTEVYAPNYRNGEKLALIRYPHGGIFEIPTVTVNNRNKEGQKIISPNAPDALGINSNVAKRLSGADFDGDTVLAIPITEYSKIKTAPPLKDLENFDPQEAYPGYKGMPKMTERTKQDEMGKISNLITDMTLKGADFPEIARAVKHSMVVIDAVKHNLNYKQSYIDNGIPALKKKYQGGANKGASTLISKASADKYVDQRSQYVKIDDGTGELIFKETGRTRINKQGKEVKRKTKTTQMAYAKDAYELYSGTKMEGIYADYANKLKAMANEARKESVAIKTPPVNQSAKKVYAEEIESLNRKVKIAKQNRPRERQAQLLARERVRAAIQDNPDIKDDKDHIKKLRTQALNAARESVGSIPRKERYVPISPREWEAIQAHAVSNTTLETIIENTDMDELKELSMPKDKKVMSSAMKARAKSFSKQGYTLAQIADILGVSTTTVSKAINE